jgi:hypothetical protein
MVCEITIDLETIPSQLPWVKEYVQKDVKPPGNIKKAESIQAWYETKQGAAVQDALNKCSLDGAMNHIICIGFAVDDGEPKTFYCGEDPVNREAPMIKAFYDYVQEECGNYAHKWIGHHVVGFDLKILRQRSIILGIKWPPIMEATFQDKWGELVYDTMLKWSNDRRDFVSLEKLALAFGLESPKESMSGSQVYQYWQADRHQEIMDYCKGDIETTRAVYRCMTMSV